MGIVDDQVGSPTYTKDLAKAILRLLEAKWFVTMDDGRWTMDEEMSGIYHVSNKGTVSWFDYAKEIFKTAGIDDVRLAGIKSNELARPAARPAFSALDNAKFEKVTDFAMRPWQAALREYVNTRD